MKHLVGRDGRRYMRESHIRRRREIIKQWRIYVLHGDRFKPEENSWWVRCAKHNGAHGCRMCKYDKYHDRLKRARLDRLKRAIFEDLRSDSWDFLEPIPEL